MIQQHKAIILKAKIMLEYINRSWSSLYHDNLASIFGNNQAFAEVFMKVVGNLDFIQGKAPIWKWDYRKMEGTLGLCGGQRSSKRTMD